MSGWPTTVVVTTDLVIVVGRATDGMIDLSANDANGAQLSRLRLDHTTATWLANELWMAAAEHKSDARRDDNEGKGNG